MIQPDILVYEKTAKVCPTSEFLEWVKGWISTDFPYIGDAFDEGHASAVARVKRKYAELFPDEVVDE